MIHITFGNLKKIWNLSPSRIIPLGHLSPHDAQIGHFFNKVAMWAISSNFIPVSIISLHEYRSCKYCPV